jgi:metal-responsive CopG/Arc/MetJ family transcriptional regulator
MPRGRPKTNWNKRSTRPVISVRLSRELDEQFTALRYEAGDINRSDAIKKILEYLLKPSSISTTKAIIQG